MGRPLLQPKQDRYQIILPLMLACVVAYYTCLDQAGFTLLSRCGETLPLDRYL
jgi:hypothetical protein